MSNIIPINFEGHSMRFSEDGWIDATTAAEKFGKLPNEFLRLPETEAYIQALERRCGKIPYVKTSKARKDRGGGTWLHPKLAVRFARWLSVDFEIWCDEQIDSLIRGHVINYTDQQIIALLTHQDATTWEKRFKDPFYSALSKLTRLPYNGHIGGCPALFGKITADWVYGVALPDVVYESVKDKANGREKIHQFLKPELLAAVEHQLMSVTALANGCVDYKDFEARCTAAYGLKGQLKLIYPSAA
ncbi:KilA-N domain-containing protein [Yersinia enterocolitica]|uniref:KilA-N domain-containing protein n=1 Tax=Yersinia TaxID=629 RepID=UPI0005E73DC6|nr:MULTISPECIES: KilA-N domain-containing protein [Yersinia]ELI6453476.1 KilA-N domain-containing protein [Yersinia ruckeri]EKN3337253.1 KilA-N domain-containing protein [Yersinia enterocolitica]EKN3571859.1 KilA-N domain-containing protein [Yersinia enterocolitica]EKN3597691.1 KilA-N domain-containing protein [Yersinia enterocolitica]EKN3753869.1 KilA-N domain-containing protein [Yersinia enterocolitica]